MKLRLWKICGTNGNDRSRKVCEIFKLKYESQPENVNASSLSFVYREKSIIAGRFCIGTRSAMNAGVEKKLLVLVRCRGDAYMRHEYTLQALCLMQ